MLQVEKRKAGTKRTETQARGKTTSGKMPAGKNNWKKGPHKKTTETPLGDSGMRYSTL